MALQDVPKAATDYATTRRHTIAKTVAAVDRLWARIGDDFDAGFSRVAYQMLMAVGTAQYNLAADVADYYPAILDATGQAAKDTPSFKADPINLVGYAGDGMPTETLLYEGVVTAKIAVSEGATAVEARRRGGDFLTTALATALSDTARSASALEQAARPLGGYVRMLTPPSCGRCVILAGKWYRSNKGFERHPGCDCVHIPAAESIAGDMTVDADAYLEGLSDDELAKTLGSKANAKVYREHGADSRQIVNAYRNGGGIRTAQIPAQFVDKNGELVMSRLTVKASREGTTVRGYAASQMQRVRRLTTVKDGGRYVRVTAPRLMPESILAIAKNKDHARRLLRDHGWI